MATAPSELTSSVLVQERRDAFYWRLIVSALSFGLFGVGALLIGALLPLVRLAPAPSQTKRRRARAVIRVSLRMFVGVMRGLGGLTYEFRGLERLGRPGQLIIANHPSLIDVVFLLAFSPNANCVVKHGLWRNPFTRSAVSLAEYISNECAATMIEGSSAALAEGQTLIMFPEGTRTKPGQRPVFQRGAANIALRAARIVTPVYISCAPPVLSKAEPWWRISLRRPHFAFTVGEDVPLDEFRGQPSPLGSRRLNASLQRLFGEP